MIKVPTRAYAYCLLAIAALIFSRFVYLYWPFTIDDSFISFRYAWNLASGNGPVFNASGPPAEGYTSFLWVVVMSVPHLLGLDALVFSKVVGIISITASAYLVYLFTFRAVAEKYTSMALVSACFSVLLLALYFPTSVHAVTGMETALFTFILTLYFYQCYIYSGNPSRRYAIYLSLNALLLGLTRPEGNMVAALSMAIILLRISADDRRTLLKWALTLYVVPGALYFIWRVWYYGHLFPLPFYIKAVAANKESAMPGFISVVTFYTPMARYILVLLLAGLISMRRSMIPAAASVGAFSIFYVFPLHLMGYFDRFMFPLAPFIFILAGLGLAECIEQLRQLRRRTVSRPLKAVAMVFLVLVMALPIGLLSGERDGLAFTRSYSRALSSAHIWLGKQLRILKDAMPGATLAIGDAGAVPYYSQWKAIDTLGLNDTVIATTGKLDPFYVMRKNPNLVILISEKPDFFMPGPAGEFNLYTLCIKKGMRRLDVLPFGDDYYLWILGYPGSSAAWFMENIRMNRLRQGAGPPD